MIVQLLGLPGSGKTLAAARALQILSDRGLDCVGPAELDRYRSEHGDRFLSRTGVLRRWYHFSALCWRHPGLVARVAWLTLLHGPFSRRRWRKARRALAMQLMITRLPGVFPGRVLILDEGFLQKLWSTLVESAALRGLSQIEALLAHCYGDGAAYCIQLEISDQLANERVFARASKGRFNRDAGESRRGDFNRWLAYHHALMARLPAGAIVASIDASASPEEVAQSLADAVEAAVKRARP